MAPQRTLQPVCASLASLAPAISGSGGAIPQCGNCHAGAWRQLSSTVSRRLAGEGMAAMATSKRIKPAYLQAAPPCQARPARTGGNRRWHISISAKTAGLSASAAQCQCRLAGLAARQNISWLA